MVKTIFFDLDDTLLDFRKAESDALSRALRQAGITPTPAILERYHVLNIRQWELLEEGVLTREQVLLRRFELLFAELEADCSAREVCDRYEGYLAEGYDLLPGAEDLLRRLAPRYDLYLATNGSAEVQRSRLRGAGIGPYFTKLFISEEVGFHKPSPAFFSACFTAIPDFDPAAALMVGDSLTSDIRGGIGAGIRTCWYDPHGRPTRPDIMPDYRIADLAELPSLLERI